MSPKTVKNPHSALPVRVSYAAAFGSPYPYPHWHPSPLPSFIASPQSNTNFNYYAIVNAFASINFYPIVRQQQQLLQHLALATPCPTPSFCFPFGAAVSFIEKQ